MLCVLAELLISNICVVPGTYSCMSVVYMQAVTCLCSFQHHSRYSNNSTELHCCQVL